MITAHNTTCLPPGGHPGEQRRHRDGAELPGQPGPLRREDFRRQHHEPLLGECFLHYSKISTVKAI